MNDLQSLIQKRKSLIYEFVRETGESVFPVRNKVMEQWKNYCTHCPPDTFLILCNLQKHTIIQTHGAATIGFEISNEIDLQQHTHENHQLFYSNFILSIKLISYKYADKKSLLSLKFVNLRAIKNTEGDYIYSKITSSPVSIDKNGYINEMVSWYTPITSYTGEPFVSKLIINEKSAKKNQIKKYHNQMLKESYNYIQFTKRQKEIISLMKNGIQKSDIAYQLNISIRTVEKYKEMIFSKGKVLIPYNRFRSADDVVFHLSEMGFI